MTNTSIIMFVIGIVLFYAIVWYGVANAAGQVLGRMTTRYELLEEVAR
ncbi:hypothetical protein HY468_00340 [Candidatus Roizmanbacteria bacterium]|nr:hypothetical protein [Candidatus Roizmanbacteria bacterium]